MPPRSSRPGGPRRTRAAALALAAVLASLTTACASPSPAERLQGMYARSEAERGRPGGLDADNVRSRARRARALVAAGSVTTAEGLLLCARLLLDTDEIPTYADKEADLALGKALSIQAAGAGDPRGYVSAAVAIDKLCVLRGLPQRFGTQYLPDAAPGHWTLYTVDPATTDDERLAMGVVPLAEARRREAVLNAAVGR